MIAHYKVSEWVNNDAHLIVFTNLLSVDSLEQEEDFLHVLMSSRLYVRPPHARLTTAMFHCLCSLNYGRNSNF